MLGYSTDPVQDVLLGVVVASTVWGTVRNHRSSKITNDKVDVIHGLVNAQLTAQTDRGDDAVRALDAAKHAPAEPWGDPPNNGN